MKSDFFYSKSTGLYISRKPLKIDSRVKRAAEKNNIEMGWDDEGRINFIDFDNAKKLINALNSTFMTPIQYWKIFSDAKKAKDKEMIEELTSDRYCEWLNRVFLREGMFVDDPKIIGKYKYDGKKQKSIFPCATPGWFNPKNNIDKSGIPKKVEIFREKFVTSWKYWSPNFSVTILNEIAPIRGYVTSVGKPSYDMGMPVDAKQPMLMIRECRIKPLETPVKEEIIENALDLLQPYNSLTKNLRSLKLKRNYDHFYKNTDSYINFVIKYGKLFRKSKEIVIYKIRERYFDVLGLIKVREIQRKNKTIRKIDKAGKILSGLETKKVNYQNFSKFVRDSKKKLRKALRNKKDIVFIMGHKNPDSDTVISSLFEAWRNHILDRGKVIYVPIIQNYKVPDEVVRLLGKEISDNILLDREKLYERAKKTGLARWISVDQNREPEVQKYFISIIDHHIVCDIAECQDLPKTLEMMGSCTALVSLKFLGMGLYFDKKIAKILYGAALMDTENRVVHKMTPKDKLIMDYLKNISETPNDSKFYGNLMSFLLNTDDPNILFGRDYKEDWGFGFAVTKVKNCFDKKGNVLKKNLIKKAIKLAEKNNINKNLPLTVLRITDYEEDNETVNRERVYLVFNKNSSKKFKQSIFDLLQKIVKFEFKGIKLRKTERFIEFWGTGMQLSRKKTAPILEPVVKTFNEYFYSPSTKLWIKRNFLKKSNNVIKAMKKLEIKVSTDKKSRINYITYPEARSLLKELGFLMLSLKEYWLILNGAKKIKDIQMIKSLQGSNFVEFLDTVITDYKYITEHPEIKLESNLYVFEGKKKKVKIPKGSPGLIHPNSIDLKTGIPRKVGSPNEYGNPDLWRYWEPDLEIVIPTRSYIFLLSQPCWDGKFHVTDSFPNLGIRPASRKLKLPKVQIVMSPKKLSIIVKKEGDIIKYQWKK